MKYKNLFAPINIGSMALKNRIVSGPATMCYAEDDGRVNERLIEFYRKKAAGGVGLVILEGAFISPESRGYAGQIGIDSDAAVPGLAKLVAAMKEGGAKTSIQIQHCGRRAKSKLTGLQPLGPSAIPYAAGADVPREMTEEDIRTAVAQFADAAERAKRAGFDSVDIHSAHGYLPAAFMSPLANKRSDAWGGSLENRCRFAVEVVRAMKARVGDDFPITIKISADEFAEGGLNIEDTARIAKLLEEAGIAAIQVSAGAPSNSNIVRFDQRVTFMRTMPMGTEYGPLVYLAEEVKKHVRIPVIAVGRLNDPDLAERVLKEGKADLIGITRQLITDPDWPNKVRDGRISEIRPCIACNEGCYNMILSGGQPSCACNPESGREYLREKRPAGRKEKVAVIGGGVCGLQAALTAAEAGHDVVLFEKNDRLGGQLWLAKAPPDRGEIGRILDYMIHQVQASKVNVRLSEAATADSLRALKPDAILIATGSTPVIPASFQGNAACVNAHEVLEKNILFPGERVLVIGGGLVGCEVADHLAQGNSKVVLVEMLPKIAGDACGEDRAFFELKFRKYGVDVLTSTKVDGLEGGKAALSTPEGAASKNFDHVVFAVGSRASREIEGLDLADSPDSIELDGRKVKVFYGGDCVRARKIQDAFREGYQAGLSA